MPTFRQFYLIAMLILAGLCGTGGCASKPGVIFDPANPALRWPPSPDEPRIAYVGELRTDADLKPGRGFGGRIHDLFVGKDDPNAMVSPMGVCTDEAGRVFVADPGVPGVHVFDLNTRNYQLLTPPKGKESFISPVAVVVDREFQGGRVLVADSARGAIFVFTIAGEFVELLGTQALRRPVGMALEPGSGRILVADTLAHQIVVLSPSGLEERRIGERGSGLGQFNFPTNLAFDHQGRLLVSDTLNFRVQVLGKDLSPRTQIGTKGDLPGYFSQPKGITIDAFDHLYVVDANFEAVQLFESDGTLLMALGHEGHGPGEFWLPAGIHADAQGRIWIADSYNRRVQVFQFLTPGATP